MRQDENDLKIFEIEDNRSVISVMRSMIDLIG